VPAVIDHTAKNGSTDDLGCDLWDQRSQFSAKVLDAQKPLARQHVADLLKSGLSNATIRACGFRSLEGKAVGVALNWKGGGEEFDACLAFPFFDRHGKHTGFTRLKPDRPRMEERDGKVRPIKYEQPKDTPVRPYFPPPAWPMIDDAAQPLLITEGEKKAARAVQEGFACVGLTGVSCWSRKEGKTRRLHPDLEALPLKGRTVYVVFDSEDNSDVTREAEALARALRGKGASVGILRLPREGADKVGLDDYLVKHTADELRALMAATECKTRRPPRLLSRRFAEMKMRPVHWLVPDFIPRGSLTVIAGDGGFGKSALTLHLAACLTNGAACFGLAYEPPPVGRVLLAGCEDGEEDTILPRLAAAGAALDLIEAVGDVEGDDTGAAPFALSPSGIAALEALIGERGDVLAVVIDPVAAFVPDQIDDHKDAHARRMLRPLAEMAERTGVAVILIKHLNKSDSGNAGNLVSGSRAYVNASRAAFLLGPDPEADEDEERRVLVYSKRNLTTRWKGLAFKAEPLTFEEQGLVLAFPQAAGLSDEEKDQLRGQLFRLKWLGETDVTERDLARARRGKGDAETRSTRAALCAEWLRDFLGECAYPDAELAEAARQASYTPDNLKEAKAALRKEGALKSKPDGKGGPWWNGSPDAMRGKPAQWKRRPDPKSRGAATSPPETPETPQTPETCAAAGPKSRESRETGESRGHASAAPETCADTADPPGCPVGRQLDALAEEARAGVPPCAILRGDGMPPEEDHQA
jgi:hypothetical protein